MTRSAFEHPELQQLRRLVLPPPFDKHLVFYRVLESEKAIDVVRIIHGARDLPRRLVEIVGEHEDDVE